MPRGGVKLAWRKVSSFIVSSLEVYKFRSLEGGKYYGLVSELTGLNDECCVKTPTEQLPLLWGGRSCVSIANNRFGEGVHPVRVNTCHCEGSKCNGLVSVPTSLKVEGKRGKYNGLDGQPTRHCEACEARRGNPVDQSQIPLDCFTTFAMTVNRHSEGVARRVSLLMLRGFFAPLCSALNDKTVTNFSTLQPFNFSTNTPSLEGRCKAC